MERMTDKLMRSLWESEIVSLDFKILSFNYRIKFKLLPLKARNKLQKFPLIANES
jgi:hypothetical protein